MDSDCNDCPICLCGIEATRLAKLSGCLHAFCYSCILQWAQGSRLCPLCKRAFSARSYFINNKCHQA